MRKACSKSRGFPNTSPPSSTTVSEPKTILPQNFCATFSAFSRAFACTRRSGGKPEPEISSASETNVSNAIPARSNNRRRRGEAEASIIGLPFREFSIFTVGS